MESTEFCVKVVVADVFCASVAEVYLGCGQDPAGAELGQAGMVLTGGMITGSGAESREGYSYANRRFTLHTGVFNWRTLL